LNLLVAPGHFKRFVILTSLKLTGNYKSMSGLIMKYEPLRKSNETNMNLYDLFLEGINSAADIIKEFIKNIKSNDKLNERFNRNFE